MAFKFNPFTGKLDQVNPTGGGGTVPEYSSDPASPSANDTWVLRTTYPTDGTAGNFRILGLNMLYAGSVTASTYQLSYQTEAGITKRVSIT